MLKQIKLNAALKKRSTELSELLEKRTSRDTKIEQLREALDEAQTEEDISTVENEIENVENEFNGLDEKVTQLEKEINDLKEQIKELEEKEPEKEPQGTGENEERTAFMSNYRTRGIFGKLPAETRNSILKNEEVKAFVHRTKDIIRSQKRDITGAELNVPQILLGITRDHVWETSKLIGKVNCMSIGGNARQPVTGSVPEAVWTEAIAGFNEDKIELKAIDMDSYMVSAFVPVPNSVIEDTDESFISMILDFLTGGIGRAVDKAILYGKGNGMCLGVVTRLAQTAKPSDWSNNAPDWVDLHTSNVLKLDLADKSGTDFYAALGVALGTAENNGSSATPFWCMNRKTRIELSTKALAFDSAAALKSSVDNTVPFDGGEIIELDFIPDREIVGGYGQHYLLTERKGLSLGSSEHVRFIQHQTVFAGWARFDGAPVFGNSFVVLNYGNIEPATEVAFAGDSANTDRVSLSALSVGNVNLFPAFDKSTLNYMTEVSTASNKITATALKNDATVTIKNGSTVVKSGNNATFTTGNNVLTVEVENGNAVKRTYTVTVKYNS